jgi:hypothetical protein
VLAEYGSQGIEIVCSGLIGAREMPISSVCGGALPRWLSRIYTVAHYGFPFSLFASNSPVGRLRVVGFRARSSNPGRLKTWLSDTVRTIAWPIVALLDSFRNAQRLAAENPGVAFIATLCDMYCLALARNIPPLEYRVYRFHEAAHRADIDEYLYWTDLPALGALNSMLGADSRDVQDKHRFANICARLKLPHVRTLAVFDGGEQLESEEPFRTDCPRFFVKNLRDRGSTAAERWTRHIGLYHNTQGATVPAERLAEVLRQSDCIVQPCLQNHATLEPLTNGALACLRIVTGIDSSGRTEFIFAMLGLPFGAYNSSMGGILCRLAPETGTITHAGHFSNPDIADHPDSGATLVGFTLPYWRESTDLVRQAHKIAFQRFAFLGWDVAITDDGPVLLETNSGWGALHYQMIGGPIGRTAFSRILAGHLNACV